MAFISTRVTRPSNIETPFAVTDCPRFIEKHFIMPNLSDREFGLLGEDLAVRFLQRHGYAILHRNFRTRFGEIDIVAQDKDTICFIEVKTRISDQFGSPFEAITKSKQRTIVRCALSFLQERKFMESKMRFDCVGVDFTESEEGHIEIIKDAFDVDLS